MIRIKKENSRKFAGRPRLPSALSPRPSSLSSPSALGLVWAEVDIGKNFLFQGDAKAIDTFKNINAYVSAILPNVYTVAGLVLFGLVLFGGFHYITGAGNQEKLEKGKAILTSALLGFAILFGSFWIIQIIQVLTGVPISKPSI